MKGVALAAAATLGGSITISSSSRALSTSKATSSSLASLHILMEKNTCTLAQSPLPSSSYFASGTRRGIPRGVSTNAASTPRGGNQAGSSSSSPSTSSSSSSTPSLFGGVDNDALALSTAGDVACRLVVLVPSPPSPSVVARGEASWLDVMRHEALKLKWADRRLEMKVLEVPSGNEDDDESGDDESGGESGGDVDTFDAAVAGADAVVVVGFGSESAAVIARLLSRPSVAAVRTVVPLGSSSSQGGEGKSPSSSSSSSSSSSASSSSAFHHWRVNSVRVPTAPGETKPLLARLPAFLTPFSLGDARRACSSYETAASFWSRAHSDDALTALLVVADATGRIKDPPLSALDSLRGQGIGTLSCMLRNCSREVVACVTDEGCKAALDCLTEAPPGDQVAAYRCIVSHESKLFEDFSLCVLTKHRCLGVSAEPPLFPSPKPQASFRGEPLTHEVAEQLFIGWREARRGGGRKNGGEEEEEEEDSVVEPWSWRVVAGQNPAYDQFNCQYQIFHRGRARGSLWYVPVFTVETLGSSNEPPRRVWRKRKYRVTRSASATPGQFRFSVLDNGVVSEEFWTIVDVPDDLGYALFSYNGAASAAGQSYSGSVLCTRDGAWPDIEKHGGRLEAALGEAGVRTWELFRVKNDGCEGAPLEIDDEG